jgi:NADH:ubiquinone oxidoreductase subunit 4 (subunit M)
VATLGIILAAAYVLWMLQRTTQGTPNPDLAGLRSMRKDLSLREAVVVTPLIGLLLLFGFYPKPLLDVINPASRPPCTTSARPTRHRPSRRQEVNARRPRDRHQVPNLDYARWRPC